MSRRTSRPSSCVPTMGVGASFFGFVLPSTSAGSRPSPTEGNVRIVAVEEELHGAGLRLDR